MLVLAGAILLVGSGTFTALTGKAGERITQYAPDEEGTAGDPSLAARVTTTKLAWTSFVSHPVVGVGLGNTWTFQLPYRTEAGYPPVVSKPTIDTPVESLAELGVAGAIGLLCVLLALGSYAWRRSEQLPALTLVGVISIVFSYGFTTNPFNEKGLALTLMMLLGILLAERAETSPATRDRRSYSRAYRSSYG
jgi:O-antigen ligase